MGWFDEQLQERRRADNAAFEDSFLRIAGAVMGKRLSAALNDQRQTAKDAIEELLKYYRVKAREVPRSVEDMNEILEFLLRPYGIMRRNVNLDGAWYKDASGAMLGMRKDDGSVVALIPTGFSGYSFFDVKSGTRLKVDRQTAALFDREAIAFYKPFPLKKMTVRDLLRFMTENVSTADLLPVLLSALAATLAGLLTPRLNALLFSTVLLSESTGLLAGISAALACASVSALLFGVIRSVSIERITRRLSVLVEAASMMRVLSLPAAFFKAYSAGELSNRVQYVALLVEKLVGTGLSVGIVTLFSLLYLTQIFAYTPALVTPALCALGAATAMGLILLISGRVRKMSVLVICGVMIGYICSAVTDFAVTFADDANIVNLHNWSRGSFSGMSWSSVRAMLPVAGIALILSFLLSKPMSAYQMGEQYARNLGVDLRKFRVALILLSSVLSACVTAFAGPISFLGVAAPHLMKRLLGTAKPILMIPACFLGGAGFCLLCDLLARTLFAPTELSISTVTAVFGAPIVICMMVARGRERVA